MNEIDDLLARAYQRTEITAPPPALASRVRAAAEREHEARGRMRRGSAALGSSWAVAAAAAAIVASGTTAPWSLPEMLAIAGAALSLAATAPLVWLAARSDGQ